MKTKKSIQSAIDAVVAKNFTTEKIVVKHSTDNTRILVEHIHVSDMKSIDALVETITALNPTRNCFWMISADEVINEDDIKELGAGWRNSTVVATSIFISYGCKRKK